MDNEQEPKKECGPNEFVISTPFGTLKSSGGAKRNAEIITIISLVGLFVLAISTYKHDQETQEFRRLQQIQAEKLVKAIESNASSQRLLACMISLPMDKREEEYRTGTGICRRSAAVY